MPTKATVVGISTYTGKIVDPFSMRAGDVDIQDIAQSLSNQSRYTGHCEPFYSVAQHSVLVSQILEGTPYRLHGLLHDAAETYLGDVSRPLKVREEYAFYRETEDSVQRVIWQRFLLDAPETDQIKRADDVAGLTEWRDLMPERDRETLMIPEDILPLDAKITAWHPKKAREQFLFRFNDLTKGHIK